MGNDIGEMSKQPDQEACCRYCRVTGRATVWTFSTGADYPQGCWCKTKQSINPNCNGPSFCANSTSGCQGGRDAATVCRPGLNGTFCRGCIDEGTYFVSAESGE